MSSPRKQSPVVTESLKIKQKLAKNWQKDLEQGSNAEVDSNEGNLSKARKMLSQTMKRKVGTDEAPLPSNSSQNTATLNVSRSGRVRKVKGVFDPSDVEVPAKRKSVPVLETEAKAKKFVKPADIKRDSGKETTTESNIIVRRKTINFNENGCQVCTRSDPKKGRFVNCIDCPARGHFTCLRNAKLIGMAAEENHWQCTQCLRCAECGASQKTV